MRNVNLAKFGLDRVMGYHRPVSEFDRGKKEEFAERKCFTEQNAIHRMEDMNSTTISKMETVDK